MQVATVDPSKMPADRTIAAVRRTKIEILSERPLGQRRMVGLLKTSTILSSHPARFFTAAVGASRSQAPPQSGQKRRGVPPATLSTRTHALQNVCWHLMHCSF